MVLAPRHGQPGGQLRPPRRRAGPPRLLPARRPDRPGRPRALRRRAAICLLRRGPVGEVVHGLFRGLGVPAQALPVPGLHDSG